MTGNQYINKRNSHSKGFGGTDSRTWGFPLEVALKLTKNKEDAIDLSQQAILNALKYCDKFKKGSNLEAWLTTIIKNQFRNDYNHKQYKRREMGYAVNPDDVYNKLRLSNDNHAERNLTVEEIEKLIDEVEIKNKEPFTLCLVGYSFKEIGEKLDIPEGTAKSRVYFATQALRAKIVRMYSNN